MPQQSSWDAMTAAIQNAKQGDQVGTPQYNSQIANSMPGKQAADDEEPTMFQKLMMWLKGPPSNPNTQQLSDLPPNY